MEQSHLIPGNGFDDADGSMSPDGVFARAMAAFLLVDVAMLASIFDTWDELARHPVLYTVAALLGSAVATVWIGSCLREATEDL